MSRVAVKICGLTRIEDARQAWMAGADLLGFIFAPGSPRRVSPQRAAEIAATLRAEGCRATLVGVFTQGSAAEAEAVAQRCSLDAVQLHAGAALALPELDLPVILARRVADSVDWSLPPGAWALLLDTCRPGTEGGTGQTWDWELATEGRPDSMRLILAGGLTPENVAEAIRLVRPWGVDVASGVELAPGIKDHDRVARFIGAVRELEVG